MDRFKKDTRIIYTARSIEDINKAVALGAKIVLKECEPCPPFETTVSMYRHKEKGTYRLDLDPRDMYRSPQNFLQWEPVLDLDYYPPQFKNAFAAYVVPLDIEVGERVWLEDLIEDLLGSESGQGLGRYRLESAYARWNGEDFDIEYSNDHVGLIVG